MWIDLVHIDDYDKYISELEIENKKLREALGWYRPKSYGRIR